ncbi:hypothetical protein IDH12_02540 [Pelagibacterales bacterium SAG-MED29]|nr:hypothetical protein [Pelagibacterales bacterium SAG-MED29]
MKKVVIFIMVSLFSFNTASADSFNLITLQGMKIGESFIKYVDEATIKGTNNPKYKNNKYSTSTFDFSSSNDPQYFDFLNISYKTSDKDYKILEIGGQDLINNMDECETKRDDLLNSMVVKSHDGTETSLLKNAKKTGPETNNHPADTSGKSKITDILYIFDTGTVHASCVDWSEETGYPDHLYFAITEKKFMAWKQKNSKY